MPPAKGLMKCRDRSRGQWPVRLVNLSAGERV
jgi:hypothetical protein